MHAHQTEKMQEKFLDLNSRFESAHPREILRWTEETFGNKAVQMSSFGLEDVALYDMRWRINPKSRLMTLDTFRLPTETYTVMDRFKSRYEVEIEVFYPDLQAVSNMVSEKGFNLFYKGVENRKLCCHIRKVEPLDRALSGLDAWITGLRRDQGMGRSDTGIVEWEEQRQIYKINPLANWTFKDTQTYVEENEVPYNELHDKGYPSIGCLPCTRAIKPGEDLRSGRWWWETDPNAKECGLHLAAKPEEKTG